jgi:arylsulfatase A-like enzyme
MHVRMSSSSLLLTAVLALASPGTVRADAARPNILLLVAEDLGPRIGAFGDAVARTPNLDRLAREGVRYPNTFTTAGVCAPSRAALITGMHQASIGAQHMRASSRPAGGYRSVPPAEVKAFPERLRAAGYYTFVTEELDYQFGTATGTGPFTILDSMGGGFRSVPMAPESRSATASTPAAGSSTPSRSRLRRDRAFAPRRCATDGRRATRWARSSGSRSIDARCASTRARAAARA